MPFEMHFRQILAHFCDFNRLNTRNYAIYIKDQPKIPYISSNLSLISLKQAK